MRRFSLLLAGLLLFTINGYVQSSESEAYQSASKLQIFTEQFDLALLNGESRYIHIGFLGPQSDIDIVVGHMDRFSVNDKDMIIDVQPTISEEEIDYYKFFLNPLYDANNFQQMLEMFRFKEFNVGSSKVPISDFSNTVYAWIKTHNR